MKKQVKAIHDLSKSTLSYVLENRMNPRKGSKNPPCLQEKYVDVVHQFLEHQKKNLKNLKRNLKSLQSYNQFEPRKKSKFFKPDENSLTECQKLLNQEKSSDLTLTLKQVDLKGTATQREEKLFVHRFIIGERSSYFKGLLEGSFLETQSLHNSHTQLEIETPHIDEMKLLICFLYKGFLEINQEDVFVLYQLADEYGVDSLMPLCLEHLERHFLTLDNALPILIEIYRKDYKKHFNKSDIVNIVFNYTLKFCPTIYGRLKKDQLKNIPDELLLDLVKNDSFMLVNYQDNHSTLRNEKKIFKFITSWMHSNKEEIDETLKQNLRSQIRFSIIPELHYSSEIANHFIGELFNDDIEFIKTFLQTKHKVRTPFPHYILHERDDFFVNYLDNTYYITLKIKHSSYNNNFFSIDLDQWILDVQFSDFQITPPKFLLRDNPDFMPPITGFKNLKITLIPICNSLAHPKMEPYTCDIPTIDQFSSTLDKWLTQKFCEVEGSLLFDLILTFT